MTAKPSVPVQIAVSDPDNVPETVVTGPIILAMGPEVSTVILTSVRPNATLLMQGQPDTRPQAIVVDRLVIPTSILRQFHANLGQAFNALAIHQAGTAAPNGGIIMPRGESNH